MPELEAAVAGRKGCIVAVGSECLENTWYTVVPLGQEVITFNLPRKLHS